MAFPSAASVASKWEAKPLKEAAQRFLSFVNQTGSPYHTGEAVRNLVASKGFISLHEDQPWPKLTRGGKYLVMRNHSAVMAFVVGKQFNASKDGFVVVAAHTDSPCLRVRPVSTMNSEGYSLLGVETYGGGLWHTWFDRGLGLAGKVIVRQEDGTLEEKLVRVPRPVVLMPNLAIHLRTAEERVAFKINNETNLRPILCSHVMMNLVGGAAVDSEEAKKVGERSPLYELLEKELQVNRKNIVDIDLCLMDATPSRLCGILDEFVESPRIDNLVSTWAAFDSLLSQTESIDRDVCIAVGFDHEEVGSLSFTGASSNIMSGWLERISSGLELSAEGCAPPAEFMRRSFVVSADAAHGVHPNYADKHQSQHKPLMQHGIVIKENVNQRYATHAVTAALTREVAAKWHPEVPIQDFVVRNDSPCGTTIGPITAGQLGLRTVDLGVPQWAMHSCRESCGVHDLGFLVGLFESFYRNFRAVDEKFKKLSG